MPAAGPAGPAGPAGLAWPGPARPGRPARPGTFGGHGRTCPRHKRTCPTASFVMPRGIAYHAPYCGLACPTASCPPPFYLLALICWRMRVGTLACVRRRDDAPDTWGPALCSGLFERAAEFFSGNFFFSGQNRIFDPFSRVSGPGRCPNRSGSSFSSTLHY